MIYYAIPMLLCLAALFGRKNRTWEIFFWCCALLMAAMAGLRWETGTDWIPYFEHFRDPSSRSDFEGGYNLMVETIRACTANYTVFLCIDALLSIAIVAWSLRLIVGPSAQALIVFYCYYFLGAWLGAQRRQLAIALCLFAVYWIRQRKWLPFVICVLLAMQFHVTSAAFLLAWPIYYMKRRQLAISAGVLALLSLLLAGLGLRGLLMAMTSVPALDHVSSRAVGYLLEGAGGQDQSAVAVLMGIAKRMVVVLVLWLFGARNGGDESYVRLLRIYVFSVVIYAASATTVSIFSVISVYFSITEVLLIPMMLTRLGLKRTHECLLLIAYSVFQTHSILRALTDLYIPYYSVFDHTTRLVIY